ncbi:MAG: DUF11 domain-containing protein [Pirellulaceae bacterium]|nr:DUF11 domain-containing protein [Pirellulaceae bacterium]
MSWSWKNVRQWWNAGRAARRREARPAGRRRLRLEPLENRRLLASDCLAVISGTVFTDVTDNGLTGDDIRLLGVTVNLYRDGGNGTFEGSGAGDDTLVGSQMTNASGEYRFEDLVQGRYFVEQEEAAGLLQRPGDNVQTVIVTAADALGTPGQVIDSFETPQTVTASSAGSMIDSSALAAAEALGGERDLYAELTSGMGELSLVSDAFGAEILEFMASSTGQGIRLISWDGPDTDAVNLDPIGLRLGGATGIDITQGGQNIGLQMFIGADQDNGVATFRVFTDAGNASSVSVPIPNTGGTADQRVVIRFEDFTTLLGGGADFTNIGAIELEVEGVAAVDGQIDLVGLLRPTEFSADFANLAPLSLGNLVWLDADNSGTVNNAETGIGGVSVNLFEDTDASGGFTNGVDVLLDTTTTDGAGIYLFNDLLPGAYIVQVAQSNFNAGQVLEGLVSSTGNDPVPSPNDGVDNDDNGMPVLGQGLVTSTVNLAAGQQLGGNGNLTVDFGVTALTDLAITKTDAPDPVGVGNSLTYSLVVTNNGPSTATGVTVVDTLPAGVSFQSATASQGSFSEAAGVVTFDVGTLADGATATLSVVVTVNAGTVGTITNTAQVTSNELDENPNNNTASEPTTVTPRIDLEITKQDDPDPAVAGNQIVYTLVVTNNGPSAATNVVVTDMLPPQVTFVSAMTPQGTFNTSPGVVTFNLGSLANQASVQLTVTVMADADERGTLTNTAQVTATETDTDPTNNSDTETTTLQAEVNLQIVKTGQPDPVVAGEQLVYTLMVTNQGPSQATGVVVTDTLPADVTFVSATSSQGSTPTHAAGVVTANVGILDPGASAQITITVDVNSDAGDTLVNVAEVIGVETETNTADNEDELTVDVDREVDLVVTKSDAPDPVGIGMELVYTINVTNNGPSDATGVMVQDTLPAGVTFVSSTASQGGTPAHNAGVVTASLGNLASGASATVTITVTVNPDTTGTISNTVMVTGNEPDPTPANNTSTQTTEVDSRTASIGGFVYIDWDNDGVRDSNELIVRNVLITLTGTDIMGAAVSQTQMTGMNGSYLFEDLLPGTYRVEQTQPAALPDGQDTRGTPVLGVVEPDAFAQLQLQPGVEARNFNFGELPPPVSKSWFLASTVIPFEVAAPTA